MIGFFYDVVESACELGLRGLLAEVPGGKLFCDLAERVVAKRKARRAQDDLRAEFARIIVLPPDAARDEARAAFAAVVRDKALALPPAEVEVITEWVAGVPEAVRVSNRRSDDPAGRTLSLDFALDTPDDVLKVLPPRPPRFLAGQAVPGREGEWTLAQLLGVGGFGEVWLARHDDGYHDPMAVKFFFDQTGRDVIREADLVKRAMSAGRSAAGGADDPHRHIVPIVQVRLTGTTPWLGFEYVSGGDLAAWLYKLAAAGREDRPARVVTALRQLCRGVGIFHGLPTPLVHRDLKPSNILLDPGTKALRITDFGIGAVTQRAANLRETRGEGTRGWRLQSYPRGSHTPTYSSPEQRAGADPDPRDDVHALGVIGYQLLMGDLGAAPGVDLADDLRDAGASAALIEVLSACVARKRERRPADARDLGARLAALGAVKPVAPPLAPPPPPALVAGLVVCASGGGTHRTIGEALKAAKAGAEIRIRPGVYREGVVLDKAVTLSGDGPLADIVVESAHAPCLEMKTDRAAVRGLTLRGTSGTVGKKFAAVNIGRGVLEMTDCDISSDSWAGLAVFGATTAPVVQHCRIHDCAECGVFVYEGGKGTFDGCEAADNKFSGFEVKTGGDPAVRNCTSRGSREGCGVFVHESGKGTFDGCEVADNKLSGFEVKSGGDPTVRRCKFHNNRGYGVQVTDKGGGSFEACDLRGNTLGVWYVEAGCQVKRQGNTES